MAARWVMEIMEPSSATISEPGGIWPRWMAASSRVVLAASRIPAARRPLVAFWEVAVPNTGPSQARAMAARTRVLPVPAGPVITSTVRGEVSACHAAAAWSRRSPRGAACSRGSCARPASSARSCARSAPRRRAASSPGSARRALRLRVRDQPLLHRQLRGGGVPRDARPRVDAAPVQLAAQRRRAAAATLGPPGTPPRRSGRTGPPRPGRAAAPGLLPGSSAGSPRAGQAPAA